MIAKEFMRRKRHSLLSSGSSSSSDASYIDCTFVSPPPHPIEEEGASSGAYDDFSVGRSPHPPLRSTRTLQIIPTLPPTRHQMRHYLPRSRELSASTSALNAMISPPKSATMRGNKLIKQHSDVLRQSTTLGRKMPNQHKAHVKKMPKGSSQPKQIMTLAQREPSYRPPLDARYSIMAIPASVRPSNNIHITSPILPETRPPPAPSEQTDVSKLKRQTALKRKSLLDLGLECLTYDVSGHTVLV